MAVDSSALDFDEGVRFPLCRPGALVDLFHYRGLRDVRCEPIRIRTTFTGFEDYWRPFLGGTGAAPSFVASLTEDRRTRLVSRLRDALRAGPTGSIILHARAWAVRGSNR